MGDYSLAKHETLNSSAATPSVDEFVERAVEPDRAEEPTGVVASVDGQLAIGQIVEQHKDSLVNYLARLSGCRSVGEDLAQETFLRFYQHRSQYREEGKLSAYLFKIATNLLRSQERKRARRRVLGTIFLKPQAVDQHEATQQQTVESEEIRRVLEREIAALPIHFRVPLVLAEVEDWPYRRIAEFLDCREGTVKSRVHRAKLRLRTRLATIWPGDTP